MKAELDRICYRNNGLKHIIMIEACKSLILSEVAERLKIFGIFV